MFEHEIKTAPPGSDRLASFVVAQGIVNALNGIEDGLHEIRVYLARQASAKPKCEVEQPTPMPEAGKLAPVEPFPHFDSANEKTGPVPNSTFIGDAPTTQEVEAAVEEEDEYAGAGAAVVETFTRNTADGGL
jgi:hypothetical protein